MRFKLKLFLLLVIILILNSAWAENELHSAVTEPIPISELNGYAQYSPIVQQLIQKAATLTQQHLTYLYGSSNPKQGGMDCSGTIYYLLTNSNLSGVPRDASGMYQWVWQYGKFHAVNSHAFNSFEFDKLHPGDLLFWTGTYAVKRDPPVSHVMMYLGKNQQGQPLMFGASDGRTYQRKQMWGVSVFDFELPNPQSNSRFLGYSCIPHLTCE